MEVLWSKTGSKGNASVISDGQTLIQIDAGITPEKVNQSIGYKLSEVYGVIVSHSHIDHSAFIPRFLRLGMKVYASKETWLKTQITRPNRNAVTVEAGKQFTMATFIVKPFNVAHVNSDGTPCENLGFLIYSTKTKEKMLWITDASYIESRFPPMDYICIECNYVDIDDYANELEFVNTFVEGRRLRSHLSLDRCVEFLKQQDLSRIKEIRLLHLTEGQGDIYNIIYSRMKNEFPDIKFIF